MTDVYEERPETSVIMAVTITVRPVHWTSAYCAADTCDRCVPGKTGDQCQYDCDYNYQNFTWDK